MCGWGRRFAAPRRECDPVLRRVGDHWGPRSAGPSHTALSLTRHFVVVAVLVMGLLASARFAFAQASKEDVPPPKYSEMVLPSGEDLLRGKPFDWIVLRTEDVLVVEPTSPRPDPLGRLTLRHKQAEVVYFRALKYRPARMAEADQLLQRDRGADADKVRAAVEVPLAAARNRMQDCQAALQKLAVTLLDDSVDPDYVLETRFIQRIVHYEDLVLRRVEQLVAEGRVSLAYDLMLLVGRRHRDNNARIKEELEEDEATTASNIADLTTRRQVLRDEREALRKLPASKRTAGSKKRESDIDNGIDSFTKESKEWEEDLVAIRKKLRFARPKDFPKPDPLQKDDILFPSWPKFDETYVKLVLKDAELQAARNDFDGAWRLLEEIWKPGGVVIGLSVQMGSVVDRLVGPLVERKDYRQARHYINRLATLEPEHATVQKWRGPLIGQANAAIGDARAAASRGEAAAAVQSIERAARIWPESPGLKEAHRELTDRHQSVRVGVLRVANTVASGPFPTAAEERARLLMTQTLFEPTRIGEQGVRYRSSYFEAWEPADLGREIKFTLKLRRADWESRGLVTSADVQSELAARLDPQRPSFDERLAGFVAGISVQSPSEFTVRFHRLPLRLESLWQFPVAVQRESLSLNEDLLPGNLLRESVSTPTRSVSKDAPQQDLPTPAAPPSERGLDDPADATRPDSIAPAAPPPVPLPPPTSSPIAPSFVASSLVTIPAELGRQRFTRVSANEHQAVFHRARPQPASTRLRHVNEVVEVKYDSWEKSLQGLLRGEVTLLPTVDLRDLKGLQDDGRFFVMQYALPQSHFLMFQPKTAALRDGQLRRAILHTVPRERLLREVVLKDAPASHGRLVTGPFASSSYGYNRLLKPPAYDPQLAAALAQTAKKQLGGTLPPLRLLCPDDPVLREAARAMIAEWKRIGLTVTLVEDAAPDAALTRDDWDICYRTARFVEPIADIWPLLTLQTEARVAALQPLPERTRRTLLELERTIDWTTATALLHRLLGDLLTEARYVPLWEVDEYLVTRKHLIGLPPRPMHTYDDIERWTLQSWYPQDAP